MATYTLYEYDTLTRTDEPVKPPSVRTPGCAFGEAVQLAASTVYFEAIPDVDARMRVSETGAAATSADEKIYADVGGAGYVRRAQRPYVYLIAA